MLTRVFYKVWNFWLRLPEQIRFLVIGGFNTTVAYFIFVILLHILGTDSYQLSLLMSWILSSVTSFVMMKTFVFCTKGGWRNEYLKCVASWVVSYFINAIILGVLVQVAHWSVYWSQLVAIVVYSCVTYLLFKYFAFNK